MLRVTKTIWLQKHFLFFGLQKHRETQREWVTKPVTKALILILWLQNQSSQSQCPASLVHMQRY